MRGQPSRVTDFRGGVNTKAAPYLVAENEARDLLNVVSSTRGSIVKRPGCQTFATPANDLVSMAAVEATASKFLVGVTSALDVVKVDTGGAVSSIKGGVAVTGSRWEFVQAPAVPVAAPTQGPVYASNGVDPPLTWTGSGNVTTWTTSGGTIPRPKYLASHDGRVFMGNLAGGAGLLAGIVTDPKSTLAWTDRGNPAAMQTTSYVELDPMDGDEITGVGKVGPYLLVFKRRKTFVIYDSDTGANRRISDSVGCCANRSIAETPLGTFFLTQDRGVYSTNGQSVELRSDAIAPTLAAISPSQRDLAAGAFFNDHYYLSISPTLTVDFDATLNSWWFHSFSASQWAIWRPSTTTELYAANRGAALLSRAFVPAEARDNGSPFVWAWAGPWLTFGAPYVKKRLRQVRFDAIGPFDFYIARDFNTSGEALWAQGLAPVSSSTFGGGDTFGGGGVFGDSSFSQAARSSSFGVARAWSAVLRSPSAAVAPFELDSYTALIGPRKD